MHNRDRVEGCLVGLAVGDALGAPLEFATRSAIRQRYPHKLREMTASHLWEKGEYTDDTEMALLLADSLIDNGYLDPCDIARRFLAWAQTARDVGLQTSAVLAMRGYIENPENCALSYHQRNPDSSAGNGALMRCSPVALFHLDCWPLLIEDSHRSARITHADPMAQSSCVLLNLWLASAISGERDGRKPALAALNECERSAWDRFATIETRPEVDISSSGFTVHTLEAAAWSFLRTDSFEEAVICAANLGDDADTVAAVAGALAGAYYGHSNIPKRWVETLKDASLIRQTALRLAFRDVDATEKG